MKVTGQMNQNTEYDRIPDIRQNAVEYGRIPIYGGIVLAMLVAALMLVSSPAAAQIAVTPTPLPQVIATQQAADNAAAQVNNLQAERAQAQARLNEINANIEEQIAAATQAAADARNAAATQNAVEAGAAIGRLEGAIAQLRTSYAGKDEIISGMAERLEQQAAQSAADRRTIDSLTRDLQEAQTAKQTILQNYNAMSARFDAQQSSLTVNPTTAAIVGIGALFGVMIFVIFKWGHRGERSDSPAAPPADVIPGDYTIEDDT